jgi:hypothetical protein
MQCPKCNQPVAEGARFCANCGQPMPAAGSSSSTPGAAAPAGNSPAWTANLGAAAPGLIDRIKKIILTPKTEWPVIAAEPTTIPELYKGYIVPLAGFSAIMSFLRMSVIGVGFWRMPVLTGLVYALVSFGLALVGFYVSGWIIDMLAPSFSGQRDRRQALKTAAYAFTPAAIGSVFGLLGGLGGLLHLAAAIWGIYLLYLGLPVMMRSPEDKAPGYTAAVVVCTILLGIVFGLVVAAVNPLHSYNPFGMSGAAMTHEDRRAQAVGQVADILAAAAQRAQQQEAAERTAAAVPPPATSAPADVPASAAAGANGPAGTAGMLAALGGAMAGNRHVDPVDFHTLKALLPESLPGMQRTNAEGSTQGALGMQASSATADYRGDGGTRAQIKIVDASAVSGLLNAASSVAANTASESDAGFEKQTSIAGRSVHEKYESRSKHGELVAIVASRFSVFVTGDGVDVGTLEQYAALVDYSKLDAMKDTGVHSQP